MNPHLSGDSPRVPGSAGCARPGRFRCAFQMESTGLWRGEAEAVSRQVTG